MKVLHAVFRKDQDPLDALVEEQTLRFNNLITENLEKNDGMGLSGSLCVEVCSLVNSLAVMVAGIADLGETLTIAEKKSASEEYMASVFKDIKQAAFDLIEQQ